MQLGNWFTDKISEGYQDVLTDLNRDIEKEQIEAEAWQLAADETEAQAAARIAWIEKQKAMIASAPTPAPRDDLANYRGPLILAGLGLLAAMVM